MCKYCHVAIIFLEKYIPIYYKRKSCEYDSSMQMKHTATLRTNVKHFADTLVDEKQSKNMKHRKNKLSQINEKDPKSRDLS